MKTESQAHSSMMLYQTPMEGRHVDLVFTTGDVSLTMLTGPLYPALHTHGSDWPFTGVAQGAEETV